MHNQTIIWPKCTSSECSLCEIQFALQKCIVAAARSKTQQDPRKLFSIAYYYTVFGREAAQGVYVNTTMHSVRNASQKVLPTKVPTETIFATIFTSIVGIDVHLRNILKNTQDDPTVSILRNGGREGSWNCNTYSVRKKNSALYFFYAFQQQRVINC